MKLPIGKSDFYTLITQGYQFVDKSALVADILNEDADVVLFTRPRRFGKTLNLSMLHHFFASSVYGRKTDGLFEHLSIATQSDIMAHQGKYPVIFLTLKDIKDGNFSSIYAQLVEMMSELYREYHFLLTSPTLLESEKIVYNAILQKKASETEIKSSLKHLSHYLYRHTGIQPIILIDEYDTPVQSGYLNGYYDEIIGFMRTFLGAALKDNPYLYKAVLTGILRVAKESLFSGLNNLEVYSLLRSTYGQYFGFTEEEVNHLLQHVKLASHADEIKRWYNGYQCGDTLIYNPWSILNCIKRHGELQPYWVNTSDNALIRTLLTKAEPSVHSDFEAIFQGLPVQKVIDETIAFQELTQKGRSEAGLWSLFLAAGYLKVTAVTKTKMLNFSCTLAVPNEEVMRLYRHIVAEWLSGHRTTDWYQQFLDQLLSGDITTFEASLQQIVLETFSAHDLSKQPEVFYHGFMLGLTVSLADEYDIHSNHEAGFGRYDIALMPKQVLPNAVGIVLEFKRATQTDDLDTMAQAALQQIQDRQYDAVMQQRGIARALKVGIAFCGKTLRIASVLSGTARQSV